METDAGQCPVCRVAGVGKKQKTPETNLMI
jgi:hypothetical protein